MYCTSDEQSIPGEHRLLASILHIIADAILCMARRMESRDFNSVSNLECRIVLRCPSYFAAVAAADNRHLKVLELQAVSARDGRQLVLTVSTNSVFPPAWS